MYDMETKMVLKHYLDQGVSKAELARRFGLSPRTTYYWIESGHLERELATGAAGYARRAPVAHELHPYKEIIDAAARLSQADGLAAVRGGAGGRLALSVCELDALLVLELHFEDRVSSIAVTVRSVREHQVNLVEVPRTL